MGTPIVGPAGVTVYSPPAKEILTKVGRIDVADAAVGFEAFGIPAQAVIAGVSTICTGANATQTVNVGFTNGGTEILNAFAPNSTGFAPGGAATGTAVGTQQTADRKVFLKASATLTTPVVVLVSYFMPQSGQPF